MEDILFDLEGWLKKILGLVPSVEVPAKKPEPEKVEPVKQPTEPAKENIEQSSKPTFTKQYPPYSPMSKTKWSEPI